MSNLNPEPNSAFTPQILERAGFPSISYDALKIGQAFRSEDRLIRPSDVEAYAYAVQDYDPWFFAPGPFGNPIAHPTILANQALMLRHNHYVVPAGLHARMVFEFVGPIRLGVRATTTGRVADKYVRRDKPYMVTEFQTAAEDGTMMVKGHFVQMLFKHSTAPKAGSSTRPEPIPPSFDESIVSAEGRGGRLSLGQALPPLSRTIEQRQIDIYSGVKPLSIHTDEQWARAKGFSTTIAQGMMSTAYVSTVMTTAVGQGFVVGGQMEARFLRPVLRGDTLEISGTVAGFTRDKDRIRVHVNFTAHNQRNEQTLAATSSGLCY